MVHSEEVSDLINQAASSSIFDVISSIEVPQHIKIVSREILGLSPETDITDLNDEEREELLCVMSGLRNALNDRKK